MEDITNEVVAEIMTYKHRAGALLTSQNKLTAELRTTDVYRNFVGYSCRQASVRFADGVFVPSFVPDD